MNKTARITIVALLACATLLAGACGSDTPADRSPHAVVLPDVVLPDAGGQVDGPGGAAEGNARRADPYHVTYHAGEVTRVGRAYPVPRRQREAAGAAGTLIQVDHAYVVYTISHYREGEPGYARAGGGTYVHHGQPGWGGVVNSRSGTFTYDCAGRTRVRVQFHDGRRQEPATVHDCMTGTTTVTP